MRRYEIGEEKVTHHSNTGARKSDMVSIADSGRGGFVRSARTTTKFGEDDKQMIETRCVIEDGLSHNQVGQWWCVPGAGGVERIDVCCVVLCTMDRALTQRVLY